MAENDTASVIPPHQPKPKTASERGKAFRERQRNRTAIKSGKPAPQPIVKPATFANAELPFAALERTTAELIASCQRGIEAARTLRGVA